MNCICLVFILIFVGGVVSFIMNYLRIVEVNVKILELYDLNMRSELITAELLPLQNTHKYAGYFQSPLIPDFNETEVFLNKLVGLGKQVQQSVLPNKYYFDSSYNTRYEEYQFNFGSNIRRHNRTIESIVNNYFTTTEYLLRSNTIKNMFGIDLQEYYTSNFYLKD